MGWFVLMLTDTGAVSREGGCEGACYEGLAGAQLW